MWYLAFKYADAAAVPATAASVAGIALAKQSSENSVVMQCTYERPFQLVSQKTRITADRTEVNMFRHYQQKDITRFGDVVEEI